MRGYFSQLIEKTSIRYEPVNENQDNRNKIVDSSQMSITPIEVEERRFVEPQSQVFNPTLGKKENFADHKIVIDHHGKENEKPIKEKIHHGEVQVQNPIKKEIPRQDVKVQKPIKDEIAEGSSTTSSSFVSKIHDEKLNELEKSLVSDAIVLPKTTVQGEKEDTKPDTLAEIDSTIKFDDEQKKSRYFTEIRKWVAGSPVVTDNAVKMSKIRKMMIHPVNEIAEPNSYSGWETSQKNAEPEMVNYELSIGTINLNVEAPSKTIPKSLLTPQEIKSESSHNTRLNRHYLRTW